MLNKNVCPLIFYFQMLNLTEPYSPFSTTTFTFLVIRLCQNFPATFYYHTKIAPRIKGMPRHHNHTCTHKEARDQISLATIKV